MEKKKLETIYDPDTVNGLMRDLAQNICYRSPWYCFDICNFTGICQDNKIFQFFLTKNGMKC